MTNVAGRKAEEARRLERGLIRIRWFGVGLALYLVTQTSHGPAPHPSSVETTVSYGLTLLLALGNVGAWALTRHPRSARSLELLGVAMFVLDTLALLGFAWAGSYDPRNPSWAVLYVLPLEGAIRYGLLGALAAAAVCLVSEIGREAFLAVRFSSPDPVLLLRVYPFRVANVAFHGGLEFVVALVAGLMARSLAHERMRAEESARASQEAADRESSARAELAALNTALLRGVAAEDLDPSLQAMAEAIGRDMDFECFVILLREGNVLVEKGLHGSRALGRPVTFGEGVTGHVAATREPIIVPDVGTFPSYLEVNPEVRSEMAAPMRIGDEVIGVLDVTSPRAGAFGRDDLARLIRLADQFALVTHSNRLLSQQRETVRRLEELDQMKSDFVAITSHELRTPITAIRGYVRTLLDHGDRLSPEQTAGFLATVDRQSARLARLVDDLLLMSKIEAGTVRLAKERVDLTAFLAEVVDGLGQAGREQVRIRLEPEGSTAVMDPHRVDQILRNLLENALKFSDPGAEVALSAVLRGDDVELAVADRGVGIHPEEIGRIFDRFHQAGNALTRGTDGAGLGLYITKRLVEAMGGTIQATSTPGRGSVFVVRIPNAAEAAGMGSDAEPERRAS
jgi:signal transduction histidine kinase